MELSEERERQLKKMVKHLEKLLVEKAYEEAISSAKKCLDNYSSDTVHYGIAKINSIIGFSHYYLNRLDEAILSFEIALKVYNEIQPYPSADLVQVHNSLSSMYRLKGNYLQSFECIKKSIMICDVSDLVNSTCFNNLAILYHDLDNQDMAIYYYQRAIEIEQSKSDSDPSAIRRFENNLCSSFLKVGKIDKAYSLYLKSLKDSNSTDHFKMLALKGVGLVYLSKEEFHLARMYLTRALKLSETLKNSMYQVHILNGLCDVYRALNEKSKNEENLKKFIRLAKNNNKREFQIALEKIVQFCVENLDYKSAIRYKKEIIELKNNRVNDKSFYHIQIEFEIERVKYLLDKEYHFRANLERKNKRLFQLLEVNNRLRYRTELLHNQLKPVFIFNTLQEIQRVAEFGDKITASDYIAQFAALMRMVLQHAREDKVTLQKSIDLLNLYLSLLSSRLTKYMNYEVRIDFSNIKTSEFLVPPFFISTLVLDWINGSSYQEGRPLIKFRSMDNKNGFELKVEFLYSKELKIHEPGPSYQINIDQIEYWKKYALLEDVVVNVNEKSELKSKSTLELQIS